MRVQYGPRLEGWFSYIYLMAIAATIILAIIVVRRLIRKQSVLPSRKVTWLGISVIVLWGWYWLASAENRHANSLTDLAIEQFETIDETKWAVKDLPNGYRGQQCFTATQNSDVVLDPSEYPDGPGEDQIPQRYFAALNQFADNLEQQGWEIDRRKDYTTSPNHDESELTIIVVTAFRNSGYISAVVGGSGYGDPPEISIHTYLGEGCDDPRKLFGLPDEIHFVNRLEPDSN